MMLPGPILLRLECVPADLRLRIFKGALSKVPSTTPHDQAFVRALSQLAQAFDIDVVAEWVQDEETAALLKGFGVHMLQGALVGLATSEWTLDAARDAAPAIRGAG